MRLAKIALAWAGTLLVGFGLAYVVAPVPLFATAELRDLPPTALTDLRVMYGALQIVPGAFFLAAIFVRRWLEPAVVVCAATFGALAALRSFGIAVDGTANQYHGLALVFEIPTFALALFARARLAASASA